MNNKVLFVSCATLSSGGAERVLSILSRYFADEYKEVRYILWKHYPIFYSIDTRVNIVDIELIIGSTNLIKKMIWFRQYVIKHSPSVVLSFLYPYSMKVILSLMFTQFKLIVAERRDPMKVKGGKFIRYFRDLLYCKYASLILVQTDTNRLYYEHHSKKKVKTIYNPIALPIHIIGKALKTKKTNTIVSVGRLVSEKNHSFLISTFSRFVKIYPAYKLIVYGEGPLRDVLQKQISDLQLKDSVLLPGNSKNVIEDILSAKVFVLSSDTEGMPNALMEAMCVGLPCISTKVSGAVDLIKSGENGLLIDKNNQEQLLKTLCEVLNNYDYAISMGRKACLVYDELNVEIISGDWINSINSLM